MGRMTMFCPSLVVHGFTYLMGLRANGEPGQLLFGHVEAVQHHACVEGDELLGRGQQRIDVDLFDSSAVRRRVG